ncbi:MULTISPECIES: hypothetical protein [unclassified Methylobacterium]|uniref:hypothetical protein n=1 Tax=unclassified Methylobacterium TaxID=2615210 RepID=UPI0011C1F542|nr:MULTISPECIES: hypothetical protein [unclassified Methylobacterium]MCJ2092167.1 hypothetical protein [Methylobacterium sp. J-072]MCJ2119373.1 hypothetical protein [Methylobacterium sp. J-001]QEE41706.1 hypothetical protein FVA80_24940 [Methylobacterium sp. WL1]TXN54785.1 hypothetical protein FV241_22705 [Methylobacterium sp. WL2]
MTPFSPTHRISSSLPRLQAEAIIARLDLEGFIRSWNSGLGSIITSYEAFLDAVAFKPNGLAAFDAAMEEAAADGGALDNALQSLLDPVIIGSAMTAISKVCADWAEEIVTDWEEQSVAEPAPFCDAKTFINWVLSQHNRPAELCGPNGEEIVDTASAETLLRQALGRAMTKTGTSG